MNRFRLHKKGQDATEFSMETVMLLIVTSVLGILLLSVIVQFGANKDFHIDIYARDVANSVEALTLVDTAQVVYGLSSPFHATVEDGKLYLHKGEVISWRELFVGSEKVESLMEKDVETMYISKHSQGIVLSDEISLDCGFMNVAVTINTQIPELLNVESAKLSGDTVIDLSVNQTKQYGRGAILYLPEGDAYNFFACRFKKLFEEETKQKLAVVEGDPRLVFPEFSLAPSEFKQMIDASVRIAGDIDG